MWINVVTPLKKKQFWMVYSTHKYIKNSESEFGDGLSDHIGTS